MKFSIYLLISIYLFHETLIVVSYIHRLQSKPISTTYCVQAAGDVFIFTLDSITKKCVLAQRKKSDVVV